MQGGKRAQRGLGGSVTFTVDLARGLIIMLNKYDF